MNKPESVRLEVFKFNLSPRLSYKGTNSFRDLFIKRTGEAENIENTKLFSSFFKHFISILDTELQIPVILTIIQQKNDRKTNTIKLFVIH